MLRYLKLLSSSSRSVISQRFIQTTSQLSQTNGERRITDIIKLSYLNPAQVEVRDISGGCGSMFEVFISSKEFKGKRIVKQHQMVNEVLKEEVAKMHGLRISTEVPEGS